MADDRIVKTRTRNKARLQGYRTLALILYGMTGFIEQLGPWTAEIKIGPASRFIKISVGKFKEQLQWLEGLGLLTIKSIDSRKAVVEVLPPMNRSPYHYRETTPSKSPIGEPTDA